MPSIVNMQQPAAPPGYVPMTAPSSGQMYYVQAEYAQAGEPMGMRIRPSVCPSAETFSSRDSVRPDLYKSSVRPFVWTF